VLFLRWRLKKLLSWSLFGTLIVHPLKSHNSLFATYGGLLLILGSLALSYIHFHFTRTMQCIFRQPILLIQDGKIIKENLRRCRIPVADLHMRLRMNKIKNIMEVKTAVLEVSGYLTIELYSEYSHVTKKEFNELRLTITQSLKSWIY
jgi:uncharacterized membrane protein YcaP (DUF421 family)